MSENTLQRESTGFKIGWWVIFVLSVLSALSNFALIFIDFELVDSFIAWSTFSLYSVFILLIPFRRKEKWSWYLTWILVIPFTVLGLNNPDATLYFIAAAGLVVLGQLLTRRAFFSLD
jgi:hypothetical protein